MTIDTSGNVGIGTTSPTSLLAIQGSTPTFTIRDNSTDSPASGDISSRISFDTRNSSPRTLAQIRAVQKSTNGTQGALAFATLQSDVLTEAMRIDNAGNVGIGTVSPGTKLEVGSNAGQNTVRVTGNVSANQAPILSLYRTGSAEWVMGASGNAVGDLTIGLNPANYNDSSIISAAKLTILNASGNVGIGQTSPASLNGRTVALEVSGAGASSNGTPGIVMRAGSNFSTNPAWEMLLSNPTGTETAWSLYNGTSPILTARNSGNVGIGTTSPLTRLFGGTSANQWGLEERTDSTSIGGAGGANLVRWGGYYNGNPIPGAAITLAAQGAAGQRGAIGFATKATDDSTNQPAYQMVITQSGNVGIGTTTPGRALTVSANVSEGTLAQFDRPGNSSLTIGSGGYVSTLGNQIKFVSSGAIGFQTNGNAFSINDGLAGQLVINTSGNVGIGTTTPAFKFDVYSSGGLAGIFAQLSDLANTVASFADHFTTRELTFTAPPATK